MMKKIICTVFTLCVLSFFTSALECEYAIKPVFDYAQPFDKSTAVATFNSVPVVTNRFGNTCDFNGKTFKVRKNGLIMVVGDNDMAAFFDVEGNRITDYIYDTYPVIDAKTGVKTNRFGYYDGDGSSDLVPFSKGNKYGFINSKGQEIIPAKYEYAYGFVDGMAIICAEGKLSDYGTYTNGKYGMILEDGTEILPADSFWIGEIVTGFGYGRFYNGDAAKYLADKSGNVFKVNDKGFAPVDVDYILLQPTNGMLGLSDNNGNEIIKPDNYSSIEKINNQFIVDNKTIIDGKGNVVYRAKDTEKIDIHYINIYKKSNLYRISVPSPENSWSMLYGFVNSYGDVVFEPIYSSLYDIGEGLIVAQKDNKNYLYSYYGEKLCQLNGNSVGECVNGLFPIFDFTANKYGYLLNPLIHPKVYVNDKKLSFDVYPKIESNRTLVPLRGVLEAMGAQVSWDDSTKTVTAVRENNFVRLQIGSNILYKNDEPIEIDVPAKIENNRTLVPLRAISEALECDVKWDGEQRIVYIETIISEGL